MESGDHRTWRFKLESTWGLKRRHRCTEISAPSDWWSPTGRIGELAITFPTFIQLLKSSPSSVLDYPACLLSISNS
ncbi:hypothetical protein BDV09DRAFT_63295 [Aspergillus tetrazonus]